MSQHPVEDCRADKMKQEGRVGAKALCWLRERCVLRRCRTNRSPAVMLIAIGNGVQGAIQVKKKALYGWKSICHATLLGCILSSQICSWVSPFNHRAAWALGFAGREISAWERVMGSQSPKNLMHLSTWIAVTSGCRQRTACTTAVTAISRATCMYAIGIQASIDMLEQCCVALPT